MVIEEGVGIEKREGGHGYILVEHRGKFKTALREFVEGTGARAEKRMTSVRLLRLFCLQHDLRTKL